MRTKRMIGFILVLGVLTGGAPAAQAAADTPAAGQATIDQTPPRLSFADGQVSFWRPGAQDWATAQVNTPLAPGDELYTASPGNVELQIGSRAFVRAWANTQLGLAAQEPDFLQFKVTTGSAAFDLRTLEPGHTVEVDTPNAAFTIEHAGYYRVDVTGQRTSFITRRAGRATVTPASGEAVVITPSEEVVIEGTSSPQLASYVAPPLDVWDRWNYARTDKLLDAVSARYVSPGAYGVSDLDPYGTWRVVPTYGSVWVPTAVQTGWVPYSTGAWTLDPYYGWTWVDTAPWGWAPYHYGRWVFVDGFWAWAPGPVVARPVYAPALVAFFGGPSVRIGVTVGGPLVGWVALGWGEPVVPWWGRAGFIHQPSWRGWGGPRVVNNTVINNTTVVNVQNINIYRNASVQNAVVAVNENRFGRGPITSARETRVDAKNLQLTHTAPQVAAMPASFVPTESRGVRPPEESLKRSVVATRPPNSLPVPAGRVEQPMGPAGVPTPAPRIVSAPSQREAVQVPARPPVGQSGVERPRTDRDQLPSPPATPGTRQASPQLRREPPVVAPAQAAPQVPPGPAPAPPPPARRAEAPQVIGPSPVVPQPPPGRAAGPPPPARRTETPQVAAPVPAPAQPLLSPAAAPPPASTRRAETPQVVAPAPAVPQPPPGRAIGPPPPVRRAETPQVISPSPVVPQPPAGRAAVPPPPARRTETPQGGAPPPVAPQAPLAPATVPPSRRAETPQMAAPASAPPQPPLGRATTPPTRRAEAPQVAAPAPATSQPPAAGRTTAPPPPGRRPETTAPPAGPMPGAPANRLSPNRAEEQPPQHAQR